MRELVALVVLTDALSDLGLQGQLQKRSNEGPPTILLLYNL